VIYLVRGIASASVRIRRFLRVCCGQSREVGGRVEGEDKKYTRKEERSWDRVDLVFLCDYMIFELDRFSV
jgi:hypothetical protein